jgi:hypothetical protein
MNECLCGNKLLPYPPTCNTCEFPICGTCFIENNEKCLNCCIGVCPRCQYQFSFKDGIECSRCVKSFCSLECATLRHPYCNPCTYAYGQCEYSAKHTCIKCHLHLCNPHCEAHDAKTCVPPEYCTLEKSRCTIGDCMVRACKCPIVNKIETSKYIPNMCHWHRERSIYAPCYGCKLFYSGGGWITFKFIAIPGIFNGLPYKRVEVCPGCFNRIRELIRVLLYYGLDGGTLETIVLHVLKT